jgi:hypothetical protein
MMPYFRGDQALERYQLWLQKQLSIFLDSDEIKAGQP